MLYYHNFAPVYYGYVAGVIRHRMERILSTWKYERDEALYLPCKDFDPDEIRRLQEQGFTLRDTSINLSSSESHPENQNPENKNLEELNDQQPLAQRESAVQAITKQRERLEAGLAREWIGANPSGWLVMDGSISISPLTSAHPNIVGLIKSHNTQYFRFPEQEVIFNLKQGERSSIFQPKGRYPVCSWYLRSRDNTNQDLYFGLIRVEVAIGCQDRADEISRWILTERRPLSLPDARWDKMIYPIRDCEQFLRSQEPSRASFGWLDQ
jgi:DNA-binding transcriptional MerR regulator